MALSIKTGTFRRAQERLSNSQRSFKRRMLSDMEEMGKLMERYARMMAPRQTASLEGAIYYRVLRSDYSQVSVELYVSGNRVRAKVGNEMRSVTVGDYAEYMLYGTYNLGPGSVAKQVAMNQSGGRVKVGPNFLQRAQRIGWEKMRDRLIASARRSGFTQGRWRG